MVQKPADVAGSTQGSTSSVSALQSRKVAAAEPLDTNCQDMKNDNAPKGEPENTEVSVAENAVDTLTGYGIGADGKNLPDKPPSVPPSTALPTESSAEPGLPSSRPPLPKPSRRHAPATDEDNKESIGDLDYPSINSPLSSTGEMDQLDQLGSFEADDPAVAGIPPDVLGALGNPSIQDNTPAAEALRANALVRVRRVDKFARRIKAQNLRRLAKRAVLKGKSGVVRGKPPRVPPHRDVDAPEIIGGSLPDMFAVPEEDYMDSSIESEKVPSRSGSVGSWISGGDRRKAWSAPPERKHFRSASQPSLPVDQLSDTVRHTNQKDLVVDNDDLSPEIYTRDETEKEADAAANDLHLMSDRANLHAHFAGGADGIPTEVCTIPDETGHERHHKGDHHGLHLPQRSWMRRKSTKKVLKAVRKSYVKGKVIDGKHELYTLSIAMMLGLRTSIGVTNRQMSNSTDKRKWLESDDFMHSEKYVFRPKGGPKTPPHQLSHTFKFKDYSPLAFAYLRRMFGVNEFEFLLAVCGNANFIEFVSNAKSGQFFFYSSDGKYMIKTMTNAESKFLRRILPHYFRHCAQNPNTLLTKFLGMYRVKLYHLRRNVKFIIMNSVFDTDKVLQIYYDLKGSTIGRNAKPNQDVKKDNDFRRAMPHSLFGLYPQVQKRMREQLVADCEFFKKMKIMDYSMLVGIHCVPPKQSTAGTSGMNFRELRQNSMTQMKKKRNSLTAPGHRRSHSTDQKASGDHRGSKTTSSVSSIGSSGGLKGKPAENAVHSAVRQSDKCSRASSYSGSASFPKAQTPGVSLRTSHETVPSSTSVTSEGPTLGDGTVASSYTMEYVFEDDDENSYLEGSHIHSSIIARKLADTDTSNYHVTRDQTPSLLSKLGEEGNQILGNEFFPGSEESSISAEIDDVGLKKEQTTQQMFWPFHRFYDIHGRRRMVPLRCAQCKAVACSCQGHQDALEKFQVPTFVQPLSVRKDGGLMMDTTDLVLPVAYIGPKGKEQLCEGKIVYMGIIDILQQYNIRKRLEAKWRRFQGAGWYDASCVQPDLYADRFVDFFDEYTERQQAFIKGKRDQSSLPGVDEPDHEDVEQIVFCKEGSKEEEKAEMEATAGNVEGEIAEANESEGGSKDKNV